MDIIQSAINKWDYKCIIIYIIKYFGSPPSNVNMGVLRNAKF